MAGPGGKLQCSFGWNDNPESVLWFQANQGKRSSFLLDLGDKKKSHHEISESPCNCYVECLEGFFFLGGFQLISSARSVEVYVTSTESDEEQLLMTCRGIPVRDTNVPDCFKVFSVVPGGPKPVKLLRLHLLSGSETPPSETKLVSIQLTGRIPEAPQPQQQQPQIITPSSAMMLQHMQMQMMATSATPLASGSSQRNPFFSTPPSSGRPPVSAHSTTPSSSTNTNNNTVFTSSSSGSSEAIIAAVSFLVRSEGQATVQILQNEIQNHQTVVTNQLHGLQQKIQQQQSMMETILQQQQIMVQKQFEMMAMLQQQQHNHSYQWDTTNHQHNNNSHFPSESNYDPSCRVNLPGDTLFVSIPQTSIDVLSNHPTPINCPEDSVNVVTNETDNAKVEAKLHQPNEKENNPQVVELEESEKADDEETPLEDNQTVENKTCIEDDQDDYATTNHRDDDDDNDENASGLDDAYGAGTTAATEDRTTTQNSSKDNNNTHNSNHHNTTNDNEKDQELNSLGSYEESRQNGGILRNSRNQQDKKYSNFISYNCDVRGKQLHEVFMEKQLVFVAARKGVFPHKANPGIVQSAWSHQESLDDTTETFEGTPSYSSEIEENPTDETASGDGESRPLSTNDGKVSYGDGESTTMDGTASYGDGESTTMDGKASYGDGESTSYRGPSTIDKKVSMVDHLSIRCCNTGVTGLPTMSSSGEFGTSPTNIDQAESIEVLAVFPDSFSTTSAGSHQNRGSCDIDDDDEILSTDMSSEEHEYEGGSSVDEDDLVSVELVGDENEEPLRAKHARRPRERANPCHHREQVFH